MNNQPQPEEIDILQFFNAVGKFFKSIFNGIKNAILSVFHLFLDFLLYLKKNYLYLGAGVLLGLLFSFFSTSSKKELYISKALVHTNYQSQFLLQELFDSFNYMIKNRKTDLLAGELGIDEETAKHFVHFEMEPVNNDVYLIEEYDNYLRTKDTVVYQFMEFKDFKREMLKNPEINTYWELSVKANQPGVFGVLNRALKNMIEQDKGIAKRQKNLSMALETIKEKNLQSLQDIDTMRAIFNKVYLELAQKDPSVVSSIVVSKIQNITNEVEETDYNLFDERMITLINLENSVLRLNKFADPLVYLSSFTTTGKKEESILYNKYVLSALLGFLLVLFILFAIDFNRYLNRYKQSKQAKTTS